MKFTDAVKHILGESAIKSPVFTPQKKKKKIKFKLPPSCGNKEAVEYLRLRCIDMEIIQYCLFKDIVYQTQKVSKYGDVFNNVVFVSKDKSGVPKYATKRGISDKHFFGDVGGSSKCHSFKIPSETKSDTVHIFECAIDLLSYATILKRHGKNWRQDNLLSLSGVYKSKKEEKALPFALGQFLKDNPSVQIINLHLDNDDVGRDATRAITGALAKDYTVYDNPPTFGKDINEYLCMTMKKPDKSKAERNNSR